MKLTHWMSSRGPTRLGISLGVRFLEESCSVVPTCAIVSISNLYGRKLEFDPESLGLLALLSVLRVGV